MKQKIARCLAWCVVLMAIVLPIVGSFRSEAPDPITRQVIATGFQETTKDAAENRTYEKTLPLVSYKQTLEALKASQSAQSAELQKRLKDARSEIETMRSDLVKFTALNTTTSRIDTLVMTYLVENPDPERCPPYTGKLHDQWIDATVQGWGDTSIWKIQTRDQYDLADEWDARSGQFTVHIKSYSPYTTVDPSSNTFYLKAPKQKPKLWGAGLQVGLGLTPKGSQAYVGLGVQRDIFQW